MPVNTPAATARHHCAVAAYTLTCALGHGLRGLRDGLSGNRMGLSDAPFGTCDIPTWTGRVAGVEDVHVEPRFLSRNNQLALLGLEQDGFAGAVAAAVQRHGATRVGVAIGTSTSSIGATEAAWRHRDGSGRFRPEDRQPDVHNPHSPGAWVAHALGLPGPCVTVSAACASSAKVFATAARWLHAGLVDAVVVGGVDTLCLSTLHGFHSLQLVSTEPTRPFDRNRAGISLGEAAGYALLVRPGDAPGDRSAVDLLGCGESCDAWHMSSAHPEGLGARDSMCAAVAAAGIDFAAVDYLNLHGTGTRANDDTEGRVCAELLAAGTAVSATKGWTGHTLGAAGIVEAVLCMDALRTGLLPGTRNTTEPEALLAGRLLLGNRSAAPRVTMTNSFGFGGNNCSLVFGAAA